MAGWCGWPAPSAMHKPDCRTKRRPMWIRLALPPALLLTFSMGCAGDPGPYGVGACDPADLAGLFGQHVRPHLTNCNACHGMTMPPDALKAPGPPWFHPSDDLAVVSFLLASGAIAFNDVLGSRLLLKPLAPSDGGLPHSGGTLFGKSDEAYADFVAFLAVAVTCAVDTDGG